MILAFQVGDRSAETARDLMFDLADRLASLVQLTTDGKGVYLKTVGNDRWRHRYPARHGMGGRSGGCGDTGTN